MARVQANPSLSKRKGSRKLRPTIPWYPFCIFVLVVQIAAVLYVNRPSSDGSVNGKNHITRRRKRYSNHAASFPPKSETRPEASLPANVKLRSLEDKIRLDYAVNKVKTCRWVRTNANSGMTRSVLDYDCDNEEESLFILYNPLEDHERYVLCGNGNRNDKNSVIKIPSKGFASIEQPCPGMMDRWRLFPKTPALQDAAQMPPVQISIYEDPSFFFPDGSDDELGGNGLPKAEKVQCDVPCSKLITDVIVGDFSIVGTDWIVRYSMESAINYSDLEVDQHSHKHSLFYATTSFDSEVPLPYFSWAEYNIQGPPVEYIKAIQGASFIATNCESMNNRENIVMELTKLLRVDSLGACLNNAEPPPGASVDDKKSMKRQYMFHLAFENSNEKDYITEKLWDTLESGTIPVYMGAPNIQEHAPPNSIISWHDFDSTKDLGEYLNKVATNRTLYESYHAWRYQPLPKSFHDKYDFTKVHSVCRLCRWAHARMYGYSFDHTSQAIVEPVLSRQLCLDPESQLVTHPVREAWLQGGQMLRSSSSDASSSVCHSEGLQQAIQIGTWTRTVSNWDGVLDIKIEGSGEDGVYQLTIPIEGEQVQIPLTGKSGPQMWKIQNSKSRVTVLTSWDAKVKSEGSVISIEMRAQKLMKLRVIVEDLNYFYRNSEKELNYFGDLMTKDFLNPIERFLVET